MIDFLRAMVMVGGGVVVGLAAVECLFYWRRYKAVQAGHPRGPLSNRRLLGILLVRSSILVGTAYISLDLFSRLGTPITYRTPLSLLGESCCIAGLTLILRDDEAQQDAYRRQGEPQRRVTDAVNR